MFIFVDIPKWVRVRSSKMVEQVSCGISINLE